MLDLGKRYPYEQKLENAQDGRRKQRQMRTPEYFEYERRAINDKLLKLGVSAVNMEEFYAGRLYTGPLFYKYHLPAAQRMPGVTRSKRFLSNASPNAVAPLPLCVGTI